MLHRSQKVSQYSTYLGCLQKVAYDTKIKRDLKQIRPYDEMRFGYESMASINLVICEDGLTDYLIALGCYEDNLNGVDTKSEY